MTSERIERRMAAILAADVVGYTRLMEKDEAGTLAALTGRRRDVVHPIVAKNQGRIFKVNGDGVLIEFSSAINAVQCAIEIQKGMAEANGDVPDERHIVLRIGVDLGDVMVGGSDVYGEGVNIACRLESVADPGGILVSSTVHDFVRNKICATFEDLGVQSLKNITQPIRAFRVVEVPSVFVVAGMTANSKPAVAVLPFANKSDDPAQDYFADGITEDITRELARFRSLLVISPESITGYKKRSVSSETAGRELGVEYLVAGSVRRSRDRVRINVQLIESESGKHLWDERYDRSMTDIFEIQDEVAQNIVANVAGRLEDASSDCARRKNATGLSIYDLLLQGNHFLHRGTKAGILHARELFDRAIAMEPTNARALVGLGYTYVVEAGYGWADNPQETARKVNEIAQKAIGLDHGDSEAHRILAWSHLHWNENFDLATSEIDHAIAINPNDCKNYCFKGWLLICTGEQESSIVAAHEALRRNPLQPGDCLYTVGAAEYFSGHYEHALKIFAQIHPSHYVDVNAWMAACYAELGRAEDARRQADAFLHLAKDIEPGSPLRSSEAWRSFWTRFGAFKNAHQLEALLGSLSKAGLQVSA
ncbi:MAG TPA: adenylate/guanylate cyclase domain-containing protein [Terriglobales bacterium]|nr:adenylate/guanylate cyclase domain-containing protein [Terriglobales bacterium]